APALAARRQDLAAGSRARVARMGGHELAENRAAHGAHLAGALTHTTRRRVCARRAAAAGARIALDRHAGLDRARHAEHCVFKSEFDTDFGIGSARRTAPTAASTERIATEERVEQVGDAEPLEPRPVWTAVGTVEVVPAAFLGVTQRLVRDR